MSLLAELVRPSARECVRRAIATSQSSAVRSWLYAEPQLWEDRAAYLLDQLLETEECRAWAASVGRKGVADAVAVRVRLFAAGAVEGRLRVRS